MSNRGGGAGTLGGPFGRRARLLDGSGGHEPLGAHPDERPRSARARAGQPSSRRPSVVRGPTSRFRPVQRKGPDRLAARLFRDLTGKAASEDGRFSVRGTARDRRLRGPHAHGRDRLAGGVLRRRLHLRGFGPRRGGLSTWGQGRLSIRDYPPGSAYKARRATVRAIGTRSRWSSPWRCTSAGGRKSPATGGCAHGNPGVTSNTRRPRAGLTGQQIRRYPPPPQQ